MNFVNQLLFIVFSLNTLFSYRLQNNVDEYLRTEDQMITRMKTFISRDRERLDLLKKHVNDWKEWRKTYLNKENDYISVPTNLIHLFKKLTVDFSAVENIMSNNSYDEIMANDDDIEPPTDDHLKTLFLSLVELQYTYDLNPRDILYGRIKDFNVNTTLSQEACILIGETCLENNQHLCAVDWLTTCLTVISDEEKRKKIYKQLYPSYLFLHNKEDAYKYAGQYLARDALDIPTSDVKMELGSQLGKLQYLEPEIIQTRDLCSGFYDHVITQRNFKCRYTSQNSPFLKIAPLKQEQLYDNPKIYVYREVLYDSEIEGVKSWATNELQTATVYGNNGSGRVTGFIYRISQSAFLTNKTPFLSNLVERMTDISDLSLNNSEFIQIINYSPGGFYRVHSDYLPSDAPGVDTLGNRMTTMLFYMNDVPLGGETVFPRLKVSVKPVKGSVLVWHNVHPDGSENLLAQHSACPVLIGEKWAFTQWIRSNDQTCLRHIYEQYGKESSENKNEAAAFYQKPHNSSIPDQDGFRALLRGVSQVDKILDE